MNNFVTNFFSKFVSFLGPVPELMIPFLAHLLRHRAFQVIREAGFRSRHSGMRLGDQRHFDFVDWAVLVAVVVFILLFNGSNHVFLILNSSGLVPEKCSFEFTNRKTVSRVSRVSNRFSPNWGAAQTDYGRSTCSSKADSTSRNNLNHREPRVGILFHNFFLFPFLFPFSIINPLNPKTPELKPLILSIIHFDIVENCISFP